MASALAVLPKPFIFRIAFGMPLLRPFQLVIAWFARVPLPLLATQADLTL
jgi:hypothetical protein